MTFRKLLIRLTFPYYDLTLPFNPPGDYRYGNAMKRSIVKQTGQRIAQGPFKGMRYVDEALGSAWFPKIIGTYEKEIHSWISEACENSYNTIINIGAAEGYYTAGMACASAESKIFAFDISEECQEATRELCELNGVSSRTSIAGECDADQLNSIIKQKTLILCDIEGSEKELLDPEKIPNLNSADLIVEVHDGSSGSEIETILKARFGNSHQLDFATVTSRNDEDLGTIKIPKKWRDRVTQEGRKLGIRWMRMRAKK